MVNTDLLWHKVKKDTPKIGRGYSYIVVCDDKDSSASAKSIPVIQAVHEIEDKKNHWDFWYPLPD